MAGLDVTDTNSVYCQFLVEGCICFSRRYEYGVRRMQDPMAGSRLRTATGQPHACSLVCGRLIASSEVRHKSHRCHRLRTFVPSSIAKPMLHNDTGKLAVKGRLRFTLLLSPVRYASVPITACLQLRTGYQDAIHVCALTLCGVL